MPPCLHLQRMSWFALALCTLTGLASCKPGPAPPPAVVASAPEAAVRQLARHLHDNNLQGFARDSVPAADYARLETAWREGRSRWPLTELPLDDQLEPLLATLAAPDAEVTLQQSFKRNFANQGKDLKDAAHSLGLFGVQYVKREGVFTEEERAHYAQMIAALSDWAQRAPLSDPKRGAATIPPLVAAARQTGLTTPQSFHAAGMSGTLQRLSPFLAAFKTVLADYGLPLDRSLAALDTALVEQKGDRARVRITYPLGQRRIDTVVSLQRRDGHWYLSEPLRRAELALAAPTGETAAPETLQLPQLPLPALKPD
ncbi:MAG: hypothetical protein ABIS85_06035 [Pseudoxanthomonas sp.]